MKENEIEQLKELAKTGHAEAIYKLRKNNIDFDLPEQFKPLEKIIMRLVSREKLKKVLRVAEEKRNKIRKILDTPRKYKSLKYPDRPPTAFEDFLRKTADND